jgi:hypothetical protein
MSESNAGEVENPIGKPQIADLAAGLFTSG